MDALDHATRRRVYDLVRRAPGAHLREIARLLELSITLADYHLRFLEKHELVSHSMDGEFKRFYPRSVFGDASAVPALEDADKRLLAFLRQRVPRSVLLRLLEVEQSFHRDLLEAAQVSPSTLSHHLRKMVQGGVLLWTSERMYRVADPRRAARLSVAYDIATADQVDVFLRVWGEFRL